MGVVDWGSTRHNTTVTMALKLITLALTALVLVQGKRLKTEDVLGRQAALHKEASNSIHHGPEYSSVKRLHEERLARKKAKYYKKLLGHKGEHREANTRHDQDDITLQDLALAPAPRQHLHHKENKNYNKMMKMQHLKPSKKMYKKMLHKEKSRLKKEHYKKKKQQEKKQVP